VALNGGNANCDGWKDLFENKSNVRGAQMKIFEVRGPK
jgi:hypothetical protein